ncbi:Subtilisin inhibitor 1 [Linum perenne]
MMLRLAFRMSRAATTVATVAGSGFYSCKPTVFSPSLRWLHETISGPNANPVALQMIEYALSLPRSQKTDESYAEAMLMLEQCLDSQSSNVEDTATQNSKGMALLAMSNLSFDRGDTNEAMEQLQRIQTLDKASLGVKVAALEALVGVNLELGNDDASSEIADKCLQLLENDELASTRAGFDSADNRAKALKGFVEFVRGNVKGGSAALSYGEFLHAMRNFSMAKELYRKITGVAENIGFTDINALAACNMASDQVEIAATCALGQLESHMGEFGDAEGTLTKALNKAESLYGPRHPKVGVVLTCLALMFRQKAIHEQSSSLLIQEGLYRRALELLKVPPLDSEGIVDCKTLIANSPDNDATMGASGDIAALARAAYAEALCVQDNRRSEGEKMTSWAVSRWRNNRLSLAEALKISESSNRVPVIDTRTARILRRTYNNKMAEENQKSSEEQPTQPLPRSYGMGVGVPGNHTSSSEKVEWPELVGLTAEEGESKIKEEARAGVQVHVIPANSFVTMDFRQDRVRLFVDADRKIARAPRIG